MGVVKRRAKSTAKRLVREYVEDGIYENFGRKESREIMSQVPEGVWMQDQQYIQGKVHELFSTVNDILFANGRGNTQGRKTRQEFAHRALNYIVNFEWD